MYPSNPIPPGTIPSHRGPIMGKPALRTPQPCGEDLNLSVGREPTQMGWYNWIANRHPGGDFLDIGAGTGKGLEVLYRQGANRIRGFDTDTRLQVPGIATGPSPLTYFGPKSAQIVTCLDVIEHVVDDLVLFQELLQIATERVYISTPNFARSEAKNVHHCREYTIPEFISIFQPDELWVASPDGWHNMTWLYEKGYTLRPRPPHLIYRDVVTGEEYPLDFPPDLVCDSGSPDGQVWAHYCGVFYVATPTLPVSPATHGPVS